MKIMLDEGAKMPTRAHPWDAGLDLYAPMDDGVLMVSPAVGSIAIDTGVHVAIPEGYVGLDDKTKIIPKGGGKDG